MTADETIHSARDRRLRTSDISRLKTAQVQAHLPSQLGRYLLTDLIGEGGMARVFKAILRGPAGFEKIVAVKVMKASADPEGAGEAFMQEAVFAGRLNHPNVVDVYALNEDDGHPYIAMEWVDGEPLHRLISATEPIPPAPLLDLFIALLNGLEQAHAGSPAEQRGGMLHRDIKPSNIIVSRYGVPKLVDFGIAAKLDSPLGQHLPEGNLAIGTINWMSPEQLLGQPLDERSDLFSLGLVIAAAVLGANPLGDRYLYRLVESGEPIPDCLISLEDETRLDQHLPGLGRVVAAILSREPDHRPRSARALRIRLDDLRPVAGHFPPIAQWIGHRLGDEATQAGGLPYAPTQITQPATGTPNSVTVVPPSGNIPTDEGLFVGREPELAGLAEHILSGDPLISMIGTGGAGKTRLSRRIINRFSRELAGGAWFVDLSDATDSESLVGTVAQSLGIQLPLQGKVNSIEHVGTILGSRGRMLVVLDNFEQLVEHGHATLGAWLRAAPNVQFLVTTREALALAEEVRVPIEPLTAPEAVELLFALARQHGGSWSDDAETRPVVGEIVNALDRLPLAIELAAARARLLSPVELRDRLSERFRLLRTQLRGRVDRQATLFSLIDWSWQRLEPWECSALAQLSCFRGGFTMDAAEAVVDLSPWAEAPWTLDVVGTLLEKSLLRKSVDHGQPRMSMYVSIREFAAKRLAEEEPPVTGAQAQAGVFARHGAYFAGFSPVEASGRVRVADPSANRALYENYDNLIAATRTAKEPFRTQCAMGALRVLSTRGPLIQALTLTESLLGSEDVPHLLAMRLHLLRAKSLRMMGRAAEARSAVDAAVAQAEAADASPLGEDVMDINEVAANLPRDEDSRTMFEVDRRLEEAAQLRVAGRNVEALEILEAARALCTPHRTPLLLAHVHHALGWLHAGMSNIQESMDNLERAVDLFRITGHRQDMGTSMGALGYVVAKSGRPMDARQLYLEALEVLESVADPLAPREVLSKLGNLERDLGDYDSALQHFDRAVDLRRQVGDVLTELVNRIDRSRVLMSMGRMDEAEEGLERVIRESMKAGATLIQGNAAGCLGGLQNQQGRHEEAERNLRFAFQVFEGKFPSVEADMAMSLAVALARQGKLDELDFLTLGREQYQEGKPFDHAHYLRDLAEVRLAQGEPAAAYRHLLRARALAEQLVSMGIQTLHADLDSIERRIIGH